MANRYWVGGSGTWDTTTTHWSSTSGGTSGASAPTSSDNVYFDANSFSGAGQVVTINGSVNCKDIDWSSATNTPTLLFDGSTSFPILNSYGNINLSSSMVISSPITGNRKHYWRLQNTTAITANFAGLDFFDQSIISLEKSTSTGNVTFTGAVIGMSFTEPYNVTIDYGSFNHHFAYITASSGTHILNSSYFLFDTYNIGWNFSGTSTVSAGTSKIEFNVDNDVLSNTDGFYGNGQTYNHVVLGINSTASNIAQYVRIVGDNTFSILEANTVSGTINFYIVMANGSTQTIDVLTFNSSSTNKINIRSVTNGTQHTLATLPSSGDKHINFARVTDSTAIGPANWYDYAGVDGGNNTGWTFGPPVYNAAANLTRTGSSSVTSSISLTTAVTTAITPTTTVTTSIPFQQLEQKDYELRMYLKNGTYLSTMQNITSEPQWSQSLGENASELVITVGRPPSFSARSFEPLLDSSNSPITDTDGHAILVPTDTKGAIGEGTDIDTNIYADLYVFYGGYDTLLDTDGNVITDTNGENIYIPNGAPDGRRVYAGYIVKDALKFGATAGVDITLAPRATEQQHIVFKTPDQINTTVPYNSTDPVVMARAAMDSAIAQGSEVTYTTSSMPLSGEVASYDFKLQTIRESLDKSVELLPKDYYQFVDIGEMKQYLKLKTTTPDHIFYYEQHVNDFEVVKTIAQLANDGYFIGGEYDPVGHPGEALYKHVTDSTSISTYRPGLIRLSDGRITVDTSAVALLQSQIDDFKDPRYQTTVTITDAVYDIETIKLGQMVQIVNTDSYVDDLILQIVNYQKYKHKVVLALDTLVPSDSKRLEEIKRRLNTSDVVAIADAPS